MINKVVAGTLPHMPKKLVWLISKRYVAGEHLNDAIKVIEQLNSNGIKGTVDLLGEFITTIDEADINKHRYIDIIRKLSKQKVDCSFSIKPTSFGLLINKERCYGFVREVLVYATLKGKFVRIDMEDSQCTSDEIELFLRLKDEFPKNVGLVFQAYMKRTYNDISNLLLQSHTEKAPLNFRLCKGIYVEPAYIAYKDFHQVRHHFLEDLDLMLKNGVYAAIATHDPFLVREAIDLINRYEVPKDKYEFQMLYGVAPSLRNEIVKAGHNMRVYVPFGKYWFGYCSRRIKENPKMVNDIVKALFVRG
ncbi:MAG: proline dehydrogenase family protein [Prolixibacteraceae bacterium]|jgi:proline dehydrogenase|nr:proline dehydrogenase family protein [Prolixibacteraceae bacterium]